MQAKSMLSINGACRGCLLSSGTSAKVRWRTSQSILTLTDKSRRAFEHKARTDDNRC